MEKLLNSGDRVSVLIGDAGAGKSTTLPAFIRGVHEAGGLTFACAPSSGAAMELQDKLKIQADTVQQLLVNEKLQEQVAGRTLLVDEAGLLSVRQMHELFPIAERQQCRVLLVGDVKQHHSVDAGGALRALQKYAGLETIRLKEIHRQTEAEYKKVVKLLAEKKPGAAFTKLDRLGWVREEKNWDKLLEQAAASYVDKIAQGQTCLAISPVWTEVNAFTAVLRDQLKDRGFLGRDEKAYRAVQSMQWTPAGKMQLSNCQVGDVLTFHRDSCGFAKHEMVAVVAKDERGLTLERQDGSQSLFNPQEHSGFDVGLPRTLAVASGEKLLVRANFAPGHLKNGDIVTVKEVKEDGSLALQDGRTIPPSFPPIYSWLRLNVLFRSKQNGRSRNSCARRQEFSGCKSPAGLCEQFAFPPDSDNFYHGQGAGLRYDGQVRGTALGGGDHPGYNVRSTSKTRRGSSATSEAGESRSASRTNKRGIFRLESGDSQAWDTHIALGSTILAYSGSRPSLEP